MSALLGSRWTSERLDSLSFHCPFCGGVRDGVAWGLRRWVAVLDRPLLSLGDGGRYLRCGHCHRTYDELELQASPVPDGPGGADRTLSEDERAILSVVAAAIFSDSSIRQSEKRAARTVIRRFTGRDLDAADLRALLRTARQRWGDPVGRLRRLACLLDDSAKRRIVAAAYLVSGADRELHPEETRLLMRMGEALEMTPLSVRQAMREARDCPRTSEATGGNPDNEG